MAKFSPHWDLFRDAVEGRPSYGTFELINGEPYFSEGCVPRGAKPNLVLLVELFRSETLLPREIRDWLADLFDPNATSDFHFKELSRRKPGKLKKSETQDLGAAIFFHKLCDEGIHRKEAFHRTRERFEIKKTVLDEAIALYRSAMAETEKLNREEDAADRAAVIENRKLRERKKGLSDGESGIPSDFAGAPISDKPKNI